MNGTCIVFGLFFIAFGILFAMGKLNHIISISQQEKDQIAMGPVCVNVGEVIALSGIILLLNGIIPNFKSHWLVASMIAWFFIAGFDLWYIEKSKKFKKIKKEVGYENKTK